MRNFCFMFLNLDLSLNVVMHLGSEGKSEIKFRDKTEVFYQEKDEMACLRV